MNQTCSIYLHITTFTWTIQLMQSLVKPIALVTQKMITYSLLVIVILVNLKAPFTKLTWYQVKLTPLIKCNQVLILAGILIFGTISAIAMTFVQIQHRHYKQAHVMKNLPQWACILTFSMYPNKI